MANRQFKRSTPPQTLPNKRVHNRNFSSDTNLFINAIMNNMLWMKERLYKENAET